MVVLAEVAVKRCGGVPRSMAWDHANIGEHERKPPRTTSVVRGGVVSESRCCSA